MTSHARAAASPDPVPSPDTPLLLLEDVRRSYRIGDQVVSALGGIDLTIQAGEFVAIVGQSGSGKSTLLNLLGCLDRPSAGRYRVAGRDVGTMDPDGLAALRRHTFGFVFQSHNLLARLTARSNVALPAIYAGQPSAVRRARAADLLERLGLGERLDHRPTELSGGQQQRVGIARALMNGGQVILADEPTGALDSRTSREIMAVFRALCDAGHTVVIVTHDGKVADAADRTVEIADGRIVADRVNRVRTAVPALPDPLADAAGSRIRQGLEAARNAVRTIALNRLRNLLTVLGIVVGIASVILSVAVGEGAQRQMLENLARFGNNLIEVLPQAGAAGGMPRPLSPADVERFAALPFLAGATPSDDAKPLTLRHRATAAQAMLYGVAPSFFQVQAIPVGPGRSFTAEALDRAQTEIVIDARLRSDLFGPDEDPIGTVILAGSIPARIVGIARLPITSRFAGRRSFAAMPYTAFAQRVSGQQTLQSLTLQVSEAVDHGIARAAIRKLLVSWRGREDFHLYDLEEMRAARMRTQRTFNLLIVSVAGIALLIASVGVMNMMLVAIAERTREIGLLMALGARRGDIMLQFLIEAILICMAGGGVGAALALALGSLAVWLGAPVALDFGWQTVAAAVLSATLAGVTAGVLPARRAARIDPVEALSR